MSLEHDPARKRVGLNVSSNGPNDLQSEFWFALISETEAAEFLDLSVRSLQGFRYRGGGPRYVRISSRCIRYRRHELCEWTEARLRSSTSERHEEDTRHNTK